MWWPHSTEASLSHHFFCLLFQGPFLWPVADITGKYVVGLHSACCLLAPCHSHLVFHSPCFCPLPCFIFQSHFLLFINHITHPGAKVCSLIPLLYIYFFRIQTVSLSLTICYPGQVTSFCSDFPIYKKGIKTTYRSIARIKC